jgi:iron complex outermembrane receptor protein
MKKKREQYFPYLGNMKLHIRKMKLTLILTLLVFVSFGNSFSQVKLSLKLKDATIQEVIETIEKQTDYVFLYKDQIFDSRQLFSVDFEKTGFDEVLLSICKTANVDYEIRNDRQIILKEKVDKAFWETLNQQKNITGKVTDKQGVSLPGVSVLVVSTTVGTVTDADGNFSLDIPTNAEKLQFSFVGMKTQELPLDGRTTFYVTMEEESIGLDEVVAVGYGTVRKSDLTGSLVSLSSDKFKDLPQSSVTQILQGKAAGVNITSTSGAGNANIRIRGITSLNKSSEPLWVVDGVIGGTIGNFYDIESIEILKDASSTAIYGSQGANGVILVTTKKPQAGMNITMDARYSWKTMRKIPDMLSPYLEQVPFLRQI